MYPGGGVLYTARGGYKLLVTAQERWRRFNGHELITEVLDGATFKDGVKVTDDQTTTQDEEVAA
jgi:putative transposase